MDCLRRKLKRKQLLFLVYILLKTSNIENLVCLRDFKISCPNVKGPNVKGPFVPKIRFIILVKFPSLAHCLPNKIAHKI